MKVKIVEADRPETQEEEDAYFKRYFGEQLNRIAKVSSLPGSPTLHDCVTQVIEWIADKPCEQPNHKFADQPGKYCGFCITCKARREAKEETPQQEVDRLSNELSENHKKLKQRNKQ